jgi:hypothetical protein
MKPLIWLIVGAALLCHAVPASIEIVDARDVPLVHVYLVPWELDVNRPLEAEDVRKSPWMKMEILEPALAHPFIVKIRELPMSDGDMPDVVDVRVVIELVKEGQPTERYVATYTHLISPDGTKAARIDESFRKQFRVLDK